MKYSPLCDTDLLAYFAYLYSNTVRDGSSFESAVYGRGGGRGYPRGGRSGSNGGVVADVFSRFCVAASGGVGGLDVDSTARFVCGGVDGVVDGDGRSGEKSAVGLGDCDDGHGVSGLVGAVCGRLDGDAEKASGASEEARVDSDEIDDPLAGLTGRRRRKKKRALVNERRRVLASGLKAESVVDCDSGASVENVVGQGETCEEPPVVAESVNVKAPLEQVVASGVPEWRIKNPVARVHKGYFSECSLERQRELRESRALMLVAKNKAEAAKAETEARRAMAQLKSQEIERGVELRRLKTEAELKTAAESKFGVGYCSGYAKTIVEEGLTDIIPVPSSDGSVSPDSSVSVAMVRRLEKALENVSEKLAEEQKKNKLLSQVAGTGGAEEVQGTVPKGFRGIITVSPAEEAAMFDRMHAAEQKSFHDGLTGYAELQLAGVVPNEPLGAWGPRGA